jgi:hypothetical protein
MLGSRIGVGGAFFWRFNPAKKTLSNSHEWRAEGRPSAKAGPQNIPARSVPWAAARLMKGDIRLIEKAVFSAEAFPQQNLLCDFREAFFPRESMQLLLNIAVEMAKYRLVLTGRIAHVSSRDSLQIHLARMLADLLALKGFNCRSFSVMEDAQAWLRK